jgi:thioredoxin 1
MSINPMFSSIDALNMYSTTNPNKLMIIKCGATWCGPCKAIQPFYIYLSDNYPNVNFYEVDIDDDTGSIISEKYDIAKVPTFLYIKNGIVCNQIIGTNKENIENSITDNL